MNTVHRVALMAVSLLTLAVLASRPAQSQTVYVGNNAAGPVPNGGADGEPPFVILGEYSTNRPLAAASPSTTLPAGTVQDVKFYGQNYNFTLYALSLVVSGPNANEQTFRVVAEESFSGSASTPSAMTIEVTNFCVNAGDLLAFAGIGPYYPQQPDDAFNSDATYENSTGLGSDTSTPPLLGSQFINGIYGDLAATYDYIADNFSNQGRIYAIGVDVLTNGICTNCITIEGPTNMTVTTCSNSLPVNFLVGYYDGCCSNSTLVTTVPQTGHNFPLGTTTVTNKVTDSCGNSKSTSFSITVIQGTNCSTNCLSYECPTNLTVFGPCGVSCVTISNYPPALATNLCSPGNPPAVSYYLTSGSNVINVTGGYCFPVGNNQLKMMVSGSGQTNTCPFTLTVFSTNCPPTNCLSYECPTNLTVFGPCGVSCVTISNYPPALATNLCSPGNPPAVSYYLTSGSNVINVTGGYCFPVGTNQLKMMVSGSGQTNTCPFTLTVFSTNCPPTNCFDINCPTNKIVVCGSQWGFDQPSIISDSCCTNGAYSFSRQIVTNSGPCPLVLTAVWQITDACGNSTNCIQAVSVVPSAPMLLCSNLTITCGSPVPTNPPAYVDSCCSNVIVTLIASNASASGCSIVITQTWQATEQCCGLSSTCTRLITVFPAGVLAPLYSFSGGNDGAHPQAGVILSGKTLYGTTTSGGSGSGTVFKINIDGSDYVPMWTFTGGFDGGAPFGGLLEGSDGNLYGTTDGGGANGGGTAFMMNPATPRLLTTIAAFGGESSDVGAGPTAGLVQGSDGTLYGTTDSGAGSYGTVYYLFQVSSSPPAFGENVMQSFHGSDGIDPATALVLVNGGPFSSGSVLYGTTAAGGVDYPPYAEEGTVFRVFLPSSGLQPPLSYDLTSLHSFAMNPFIEGFLPNGLVQGSDGNLYGTTDFAGPGGGQGTVFRISPIPPYTLTTIHGFDPSGSDGSQPLAGLVQGSDGNLYGTTAGGGMSGDGTVFQVSPIPPYTLTTLHSFNGSDGASPRAVLVQDSDGNFYGTTYSGGANGYGTVFKLSLTCPSFQLVCSNTNIPCGTPIPTNPPAYIDSCCTNVTITLISSTTSANGCTQMVSQTWQAVDNCYGITNICTRIIGILPSTPTLLCSNLIITCGSAIPTNPPAYIDSCCTNVTITLIDNLTNGNGCSQTVYQTWLAIDECCGISNFCTRTISILPSAPTLLCSNLTITNGTPIPTNPPAWTDPCCSNVVVTLIGNTIISDGCTQTVFQTWQAADLCCDTTDTCTRTVTVLPVINCSTNCLSYECPTNLTVFGPCGVSCVTISNYPPALATNLCSPGNSPAVSYYLTSGSNVINVTGGYCFPVGTNQLKMMVSGSGQTNTCPFTLTVFSTNCLPTNCPTITLSPSSLPSGFITNNTRVNINTNYNTGIVLKSDGTICSTNESTQITWTEQVMIEGRAYSQTITASGGSAPYTYVVTSGSPPSGLMLGSNGSLSGIPATADATSFTVTATDANGCTGSNTYTLTIITTNTSTTTTSTSTSTTRTTATPPVINCPTNIVMDTACPTIQVYYDVTANSAYCTNVAVMVTPSSGSFFPVGTTAVTAVATDCCGNTNYCSFTVTVNQSNSCVAGVTWVQQTNPSGFESLASSSDGSKLVAADYPGPVYTSTDYGMTWTAQNSPHQYWNCVASSSDGSKLVAAGGTNGSSGQIYTSTDSGATWTAQNSGIQIWQYIASSSDGSKLVAVVNGGHIYTSIDLGTNWAAQNGGIQTWEAVASSSDGSKLAATSGNGGLYTSSDFGTNWTLSYTLGNNNWFNSIASSADGTKLVATPGGTLIYTSTDAGLTWAKQSTSPTGCIGVASSSDGTKLVTVVDGGQVYISTDSGTNWTAEASVQSWGKVVSSSDGSRLAALVLSGPLYTSGCTPVECCVPPPPNMVMWLPFDETNGSTSANLSSPANPGTQVNQPTPLLGSYVANSLIFKGTNYVVVPDYPGIEIGTNALTIDAWVYLTASTPSNYIILDKSGRGSNDLSSTWGYALSVSAPGDLGIVLNYGTIERVMAFGPPVSANQWHFIAAVVNSPVETENLLEVDGAVVVGTGTGLPPFPLSNTNSLWVGSAASLPPFATGWNGYLDEVEVYNRALSTNELNEIFSAGKAGKCKPCCYLNKLTISKVTQTTVQVNWGGCGILEEATDVRGPYIPIPNAASPYVISATGSAMFYRLECQ